MMESFIQIIQQVGFPIAVAVYLLWRYDARMAAFNTTLETELKELNSTCASFTGAFNLVKEALKEVGARLEDVDRSLESLEKKQ